MLKMKCEPAAKTEIKNVTGNKKLNFLLNINKNTKKEKNHNIFTLEQFNV